MPNAKQQCVVLLIAIVDRGRGTMAVEIAKKHGAEGGTIFLGEGTTGAELKELLGIKLETEKEIAMIMICKDFVEDALQGLVDKMQLCKPGNGIAFTVDITRTLGLCHIMNGGV